MTVWFTSDLHIGHRKVAELRGFDTIEEHDECIAERWHAVVGKHDTVWVLGDVAMGWKARITSYMHGLPGDKHLVLGNHDSAHPCHYDSFKYVPKYMNAFDSVQLAASLMIAERPVVLSHFPYAADHTEEARHWQWRLRDEDLWLLHGHTHSKRRRTSDHELHVGLDAWDLRPVSMEEIALLMLSTERGTANEFDMSEAEIDLMLRTGEPVRIVTPPPGCDKRHRRVL